MFDVTLALSALVEPFGGALSEFGLKAHTYALVTIHRAENTDDIARLQIIADALCQFSSEIPLVWPVHPRTRNALDRAGLLDRLSKALVLLEPIGYLAMTQLEKYAALIITDSGGVQKEAFFHQVPCVTVRQETEWVELVDSGWNRLAPPTDVGSLVASLRAAPGSLGIEVQPYGAGDAALRIARHLTSTA